MNYFSCLHYFFVLQNLLYRNYLPTVPRYLIKLRNRTPRHYSYLNGVTKVVVLRVTLLAVVTSYPLCVAIAVTRPMYISSSHLSERLVQLFLLFYCKYPLRQSDVTLMMPLPNIYIYCNIHFQIHIKRC